MRAVLTTPSLLLCGWALCAPAWADGDADTAAERLAKLRRDLTSDKPAIVAHAAYAASEEGLRDLAPDLIRTLTTRPAPEGREAWLVVKHLLDALICLDATVPMKVLRRFEDDLRTSVLILAVRNGEHAYPLLRKTLQRSVRGTDIRASGVAAGNLLAAARDRVVVPFALGLVRTTVSITVVDHYRIYVGGGTSAFSTHGDGWCTVPASFPPYVWYELRFRQVARGKARLLAKGPVQDVCYDRWVNTRKRFIIGDLSSTGRGNDIARGWLAVFLGVKPEQLPLKERYYGRHQWRDAETYLAFARARLSEVNRHADDLMDRLVRASVLGVHERKSIRIEPSVEVRDRRDDRSVPLPKVQAR